VSEKPLFDAGSGKCEAELRRYEKKCLQHLARVRLSHRLANAALDGEQSARAASNNLLLEAFGNQLSPDESIRKLGNQIHAIHLVALKADFELFLNRVLFTIWECHFDSLADRAPTDKSSLRDLAIKAASGLHGDSTPAFLVQQIVPSYGLHELTDCLKSATGIDLHAVLNLGGHKIWAQIFTAFQVRHLIEHRNGKADVSFKHKVAKLWRNTSWGERKPLESLVKIETTADDFCRTREAMSTAVPLVANALVEWDSRQQ